MPFLKFSTGIPAEGQITDQSELPVFIIPDISGDGRILYPLADELIKLRSGAVFVYHEPIVDGSPLELTMSAHADAIVDEILREIGKSSLPYIVSGYSFGGLLAAEVNRKLTERQHESVTIALDQPSQPCVKNYIDANSDSFKLDLIKMVNYAASLSLIDELQYSEEELQSDLKAIDPLGLEGRMEYFASKLLKQQEITEEDSRYSAFVAYKETMVRNLWNMYRAANQTKVKNMHVLMTYDTIDKYCGKPEERAEFVGKWEDCTEGDAKPVNLATEELRNQSHMNLLSEKNAPLVAALIAKTLEQSINNEELVDRQFNALYSKVRPELRKKLLDKIRDEDSTKLPSVAAAKGATFFHQHPGQQQQQQNLRASSTNANANSAGAGATAISLVLTQTATLKV